MNVIDLTQKLIACPSITPKDEGALGLLTEFLEGHGFECHSLPFGEGEERIENLFARIGSEGPHVCYSGHTDVVPAGDEEKWTYGAFNPHIEDGILYGRGASDMKGSVAAFAVAAAEYLKENDLKGSISLLITGDEEADAINGTVKVLEWMEANGQIPDVMLGGEPTNPDHIGQVIKVGRRGSLNGYLRVRGKQGHTAYPDRNDNPVPRLAKFCAALSDHVFDEGSEFFPKTNLEVTTIDVGNPATNVVPALGRATFNIRFNDHWSSNTLKAEVLKVLDSVGGQYKIEFEGNAESFITQPGEWSEIVRDSVTEIVGKTPEYTTTGGTSDARFIVNYCPIIECGPVNGTIHQVDENARIEDLENLTKIYIRILEKYFA